MSGRGLMEYYGNNVHHVLTLLEQSDGLESNRYWDGMDTDELAEGSKSAVDGSVGYNFTDERLEGMLEIRWPGSPGESEVFEGSVRLGPSYYVKQLPGDVEREIAELADRFGGERISYIEGVDPEDRKGTVVADVAIPSDYSIQGVVNTGEMAPQLAEEVQEIIYTSAVNRAMDDESLMLLLDKPENAGRFADAEDLYELEESLRGLLDDLPPTR